MTRPPTVSVPLSLLQELAEADHAPLCPIWAEGACDCSVPDALTRLRTAVPELHGGAE